MKKKLLMAAAIAFAVFAIPYGSSALSTVSVASENNTVATPAPTSTPSTKTVDEVKSSIATIDAAKIVDYPSAMDARSALRSIGRDDLQNAMNNDASTITSIADIEAAYKAVKKNEDTKIENQANAVVEAVGIVGGTFNGTYTKLALTAPAEKPAITAADYVVSGDPVYVDITFRTDYNYSQEKHAFAIPLAITVKVPAGVDGSKAVVFHFASSGLETIKPIYDSAANTLTFAVNELSTFAIAEAEPAANAGSCGGTDDAFGRYRDNLTSEIANAKDGTTVKITRDKNINALPNDIMKALYKKQTVALELEYTFQGNEYTVTIPAGQAEDNAIEWYGPLYLQMRYGK